MSNLREKIHPGLRGAIFYAAYWGTVGMYEPFLNVYFLRLGINATEIGWLAAILPLCTLVIAPAVTRLADRLQRRVVFLTLACLGYGAALILPTLQNFRPTFALLAGFVALYSIFRSPIISLADSLIAQMAVRHTLDFGSMRLWGSLVYTMTATGLGLLWQRTGFSVMFLAASLTFLPVAGAAVLLDDAHLAVRTSGNGGREKRTRFSSDQDGKAAPGTRFPIDIGLLFLLGATFLVIAALFMAGTFGAVYMNQLGGSAMMVGAISGISALGEVPGMLFGSRVARRIGAPSALLAGYILNAIGLAATGLAKVPWLVLVFSLVRGLGFGLLLVSTVMTINTRAPKEYASTYQGILNAACWGLAPLLGGPISGWIFQNLGPAALFFTAGGMALGSAVLILPTYRLWKMKEEPHLPTEASLSDASVGR